MKWLIWFLLILNFALLGFFLASSYVSAPPPEPAPPAPYTGNIKLLTSDMLAALPKKAAPVTAPPPAPTSCYEWSGLTPTEAARAPQALRQLGLQAKVQKRVEPAKKRFWVYIPPQKSMPQAEARVAELQALGIADSFIVQDPKWRYAISLGMFKDESLAGDYLQKLRGMGVKTAIKTKRDEGNSHTSYLLNDVPSLDAPRLDALKPQFPGSELNPVDCR